MTGSSRTGVIFGGSPTFTSSRSGSGHFFTILSHILLVMAMLCGSPGGGISLTMGNGSYRASPAVPQTPGSQSWHSYGLPGSLTSGYELRARSKEPSAACICELHQFLCLLKSCAGVALPKTAHAGYILCGKEGSDNHDFGSWDLLCSISLCQFLLATIERRRNIL